MRSFTLLSSKRAVIVLSAVVLFFLSCKKDIKFQDQDQNAIFPTTPKEKEKAAVLTEVSLALKEVYQNLKAYYEVNAAIYSEYYADERVLLKDLLYPETSPLYKLEKFQSLKATPGEFKTSFFEVLRKGDYPHLKKALDFPSGNTNWRPDTTGVDTAKEIFSNSGGVSIYFPYSENFGTVFTPSYFDDINTDPWGDLATVIPADREADSAPGSKPTRRKRTVDNEIEWYIDYSLITVNDAYAELNPTHIVGVGAEPIMDPPPTPPVVAGINRVFHGWSRLYDRQLDRFISFTGNGGGSEMKIARISGYLQIQGQQVSNFAGDVMTVQYTRKEIKKKRWKRVYGVWDADWKTDNLEQTYAVWEEDTQGTKTYSGSLTTTLSGPTTGTIGYNIQVQTQDELVTQRKLTRIAYFAGAKADQGWGYQMCDDKGCRYDDTFLPAGQYWPKYDEGTIWHYTWPYNTY